MSRYSKEYSEWVSTQRRARNLRRRELAQRAGIDPSYLTLIIKEGMVPARDRAAKLGLALCGDPDEGLIRAGYIPAQYEQALLNMHHDNFDDIQAS